MATYAELVLVVVVMTVDLWKCQVVELLVTAPSQCLVLQHEDLTLADIPQTSAM